MIITCDYEIFIKMVAFTVLNPFIALLFPIGVAVFYYGPRMR